MTPIEKYAPTKKAVQGFWSEHPCSGLGFNTIEELIEYRKRKDPIIRVFLDDLAFSSDDCILDIGCGQGADVTVMHRRFPSTFGGDLSMGALKSAIRLNSALTSKIMQFDARCLPFSAECFEAIYSHGVIHHSPNIEKSIDEIYRVMKHGGRGRVLLYRKYSPKGMAVRLVRFLFSSKRFERMFRKVFRNQGSAVDELFLCPVMDMHTRAEVRKLFRQFATVRIEACHIGVRHILFIMGLSEDNPFYKFIDSLESFFERFFGFYWIVTFQKPSR